MMTTFIRQVAAMAFVGLMSTAVSAQGAWLSERHQMFVALERQPVADVERLYLQCAREGEQRLLGFGEAAVCSIAHEVLLKRRFDGDFSALLAWWKAHRTGSDEAVSR